MRKWSLLSILGILIILPGCLQRYTTRKRLYFAPNAQTLIKKGNNKTQDSICVHSPTITVWIHGTKLFPRQVLKNLFHAPKGLIPAQEFDRKYHLRMIAETLAESNPERYPIEHIYLFGWSGALDFNERIKAARDLQRVLKKLIQQYEEKHGVRPRIRLITHSHGGNVALNLARVNDKQNPIVIDELILLACPVQQNTEHFVADHMFKEVFVLYASLDLLQVIDPQGLYKENQNWPLFSQRRFPPQKNVIQVKIKLNGRALFHSDFIRLQFINLLPAIIDKLRLWHEKAMHEEIDAETKHKMLSIYTNGRTKQHLAKKIA